MSMEARVVGVTKGLSSVSNPAVPFNTTDEFHKSFARLAIRNPSPKCDPRQNFDELSGLRGDIPVVFTHADLDFSNIVISKSGDAPPRIVAIIDWHQSGWYPEPWVWLKAQSTICNALAGCKTTEHCPQAGLVPLLVGIRADVNHLIGLLCGDHIASLFERGPRDYGRRRGILRTTRLGAQ